MLLERGGSSAPVLMDRLAKPWRPAPQHHGGRQRGCLPLGAGSSRVVCAGGAALDMHMRLGAGQASSPVPAGLPLTLVLVLEGDLLVQHLVPSVGTEL